MEARVPNAAIASLLLFLALSSFHGSFAQPQSLSDADVTSLLEDLRGKGFFTGAAILSYVVKSFVSPGTTLLVPTDKSLARAASIEPEDFKSLLKFHILETDFTFSQLKLLPVGTWIPTTLAGYGVLVTNNSDSGIALNNVQVVDTDICPHVANIGLSCQGIAAVLDPETESSERPKNPPLGPAPAFIAPPTTPLQSSSPAPSPMGASEEPSASVSPLQVPSPSPSSAPSPSSIMEPIPTAASPSPLGEFSQAPTSPIFQAPIPSTIPPSYPFQFPPFGGEAPAPSPSESSGAMPMAVSQISTAAVVAVGAGIILALM